MKKLTLMLILSTILLCSCDKKDNLEPIYTKQSRVFDIIELDSCEYVLRDVYAGASICHKGNCKFCKQRNTNNVNIDLPEEYKLIDYNTPIKGNYDKSSNILHIEFTNHFNK